jgi:hypothetical protein
MLQIPCTSAVLILGLIRKICVIVGAYEVLEMSFNIMSIPETTKKTVIINFQLILSQGIKGILNKRLRQIDLLV